MLLLYSPCSPLHRYYYDPHFTDRRTEAQTRNFHGVTQLVQWKWQSWELNPGQSDPINAFNKYLLSIHYEPETLVSML